MDFLADYHIIHSYTGLFHTTTAILAMLFGTLVFFNQKGTKKHKILGYTYIANMVLLNISALAIYNFGSITLFHGFAIVSLLTIILGIVPAIRKKNDKWLVQHFYFMNWSVVGLYCAFWAELGVRFFDMRYFWWVVLLATLATSFIGNMMINKEAKKRNLIE